MRSSTRVATYVLFRNLSCFRIDGSLHPNLPAAPQPSCTPAPHPALRTHGPLRTHGHSGLTCAPTHESRGPLRACGLASLRLSGLWVIT
ncbi:hypothetical protein GCM10009689_11600 [Brevibacterium antiquum]